jgi:hypothetical protein
MNSEELKIWMSKILNLEICIVLLTILLFNKSDCTKLCVFPSNRPKRKYHIYEYLDNNPHIEILSTNLEIQDTYRKADIDFWFQM